MVLLEGMFSFVFWFGFGCLFTFAPWVPFHPIMLWGVSFVKFGFGCLWVLGSLVLFEFLLVC